VAQQNSIDESGEISAAQPTVAGTEGWAFNSEYAERAGVIRTVSCIIWCRNDAPKLSGLLPRLNELLTQCGHPWEIIVVDVGSSDGTAELLSRWSEIPAMRSIVLDRRQGDEAALRVGLNAARGDAVIFLDANLHHTLALVAQMISHWEDGAEVVYALREGLPERSSLNWFGPSVFDSITVSDRPLAWLEDCAELTLLSRRVVTFLNR
jgi:glycosyltransferase involved in cell wall biosynthesis